MGDSGVWFDLKPLTVIGQSGLIIACSTTATVVIISLLFGLSIDNRLSAVVFLITLGSYSLDRILEIRKNIKLNRKVNSDLIKFAIGFLPFTIFFLFIGIMLAFSHSFLFGLMVSLAPLVIVIYSYEGKGSIGSIKTIPFFKDIMIALGWCVLVLVVLLYFRLAITMAIVLFSFGLLIKFYVMAAIYDFKDIKTDEQQGVITIANTFNVKLAKNFLHLLNSLATIWIIILIFFGFLSHLAFIFFPAWIYQTLLIIGISKNTPLWFYYLPCDLEQVLWLVFTIPWLVP